MKAVHFLDLQDKHATTINRGEIYYYCHPMIGQFREDWWPTFQGEVWLSPVAEAYPVLALSGIVTVPLHRTARYFNSDKLVTGWFALNPGGYTKFNYASDSGIPERRRNYVLHKNALLREGIVVDTTKRDLGQTNAVSSI